MHRRLRSLPSTGCSGRGTSFSARHTKSSIICHLTQDMERDSFGRGLKCHKMSHFPMDLHLCFFCRAGCQSHTDPALSWAEPPSSTQWSVLTLLSQCPTYLSHMGFMALSTCPSKWLHSVQQFQFNRIKAYCDNISRFPLCMAENLMFV